MTTDLFGQSVRRLKGDGYAGHPGMGPAGETCGTCAWIRRGRWKKCGHQLGRISSCTATDILVSAPACEHWTPIENKQ